MHAKGTRRFDGHQTIAKSCKDESSICKIVCAHNNGMRNSPNICMHISIHYVIVNFIVNGGSNQSLQCSANKPSKHYISKQKIWCTTIEKSCKDESSIWKCLLRPTMKCNFSQKFACISAYIMSFNISL